MNVVASDRTYVHDVLEFVQQRVSSMTDEHELCQLVQSIGRLKSSMESLTDVAETSLLEVKTNETSAESKPDDEAVLPIQQYSLSEVDKVCDKLLSALSGRLLKKVKDVRSIKTFRKVLMVFSLLPYRTDKLVDAIETEISERIGELVGDTPIEDLLSRAISEVSAARREPNDESPASPLHAVKNGLKSFFGSTEKEESDEYYFSATVNFPLPPEEKARVIDSFRQDLLLELGRCSELIAQYRRIDFDAGVRGSRFDQEARRDMAKRLLSRHLP
jgi:hypothetical protein